ncbi:MAG: zinc ribbon domain-containing protein [Clostridia bacterium]|nr:zinc ribbon domain-containing protein [Clostridia bacterium]
MFCKSCGKQVSDNERFCPHCGAAIVAQQPIQQQPYQQPYGAPAAAPMDKKKLFGLLVTILFGVAALFALVALIGFCVKLQAHAGMIISFVFAILACIGIAIAPMLKAYKKVVITACAALLFLGMYGISMIGISGSFGYFVYMLGFAALALLVWLFYTKNNLSNNMALIFIPAGLIFLGALLNWIIAKYFTMMKWALVFYLFDFLFGIVIVGCAVILVLYLKEIRDEKGFQFNMPNPGARAPQQPRQPQQPYQGR